MVYYGGGGGGGGCGGGHTPHQTAWGESDLAWGWALAMLSIINSMVSSAIWD